MYYCDTLHTSICFPYNGGHRRGLQTHLMLSARFLERIFQSDHYLFAPPTGSLKINTNRTLFSSTNFGEHIYLNLVLYYSPLTLYVKRMIQICTITFIYSFYSCALFLLFIRNLCCYTHHSGKSGGADGACLGQQRGQLQQLHPCAYLCPAQKTARCIRL